MEFLSQIIDFILHIDRHLVLIVQGYQTWTYLVLFLIIFAETGFVVTPFLPGDSLLFATGALIAKGDTGLSLGVMALVLVLAAISGNTLNYFLGSHFGKRVFKPENKFLKLEYYQKTQDFFTKHGAKAIVFSRFLPIFRTVAPFVAGVGHMPFGSYSIYNVVGGLSWIVSFLALGFFFGNLPLVKQNFTLVVVLIIVVSALPALYAALRSRKKT